jgi:hypothetical protein
MVKTQAHANPEGNFVVDSGQSAVIKAVDLIAPIGQLIQKNAALLRKTSESWTLEKTGLRMANKRVTEKLSESFNAHLFHFTAELTTPLDFNFGILNGTTDFACGANHQVVFTSDHLMEFALHIYFASSDQTRYFSGGANFQLIGR